MDEIFLNFSLVTTLNKALNAQLLKFVALIWLSSQDVGDLVCLVHPTSTTSQTFSSKDYKKALMCTFQYA